MSNIDKEIAKINRKLQKHIVGSTSTMTMNVKGPTGKKFKLKKAGVIPSEVAEQFGVHFLSCYGKKSRTRVKHPNGAGGFPDYQVGEQAFEFKSWQSDLKDNKRSWSGAKLDLFAKRIENGDDLYLRTIYIEFQIESDSGVYVVKAARAGRIWDFCRGGISGSKDGKYLSSSGSINPGTSPASFAKNLCKKAAEHGSHIPEDRLLDMIIGTGVKDLSAEGTKAITDCKAGISASPKRLYLSEESIALTKKHREKFVLLAGGKLVNKNYVRDLQWQASKLDSDLIVRFKEIEVKPKSRAHGYDYLGEVYAASSDCDKSNELGTYRDYFITSAQLENVYRP